MKETLEKLVRLQEIDNEKLVVKRRQQELLDGLKNDTDACKQLQLRVEGEKKRLVEIRVEGEKLNLDQNVLEERSKELHKRLEMVRNTEESKAVGKEMVEAESRLQQHFEKLDRQNSDMEECTRRLYSTQSEFFAKRNELGEKLPEINKELAEIKAKIVEINRRRAEVCKSIPDEVMSTYVGLIKTRAPYMVVEVQTTQDGDHTCSGCNIGLPPQVIGDIAKGDVIVRCENCGRILYLSKKSE